jgi:branched-chain amino acid transport system ATP-binding protein
MSLLRLQNISRSFGSLRALEDVSLEMPAGELRAVIGPNGAGKTTLFNMVTGLFPPSSGTVWFADRAINALSAERRTRLGIVRTFQITEIFPDLTVFENLRIGVETAARSNALPWISRGRRAALERRVDELLAVTGLAEKSERVVSELAHGDQRVVEVAIALSLEPKLLMLDEPTAGMGDEETDNMVSLIRRLHDKQRLSILFIEHDMDVVFGIAQRITVLDQGRVLAEGTPQEVGADRRVRAAYLGEAA